MDKWKLSAAWLDRAGIIFNFLAGFMVAPELIGVSRIAAWEERTELRLRRLATSVHVVKPLSFLIDKDKLTYRSALEVLGFSIISAAFNYCAFFSEDQSDALFYRIIIGLIIIIPAFAAIEHGWKIGAKASAAIFSLLYLGPLIFVAIIVTVTILKFTNWTLKMLAGDGKLKGMLVTWGVLLLIAGNLIQFIATFL